MLLLCFLNVGKIWYPTYAVQFALKWKKMAGYSPANYHESIDKKKHYNSALNIEWIFPLT